MDDVFCVHFITLDDKNRIINGFSNAFQQPTETDICISVSGGYQFRLFPDGEENPVLFDFDGMIPLYKYENNKVAKRTEEEIEADRAAIPSPISQLDIIEAQVAYTAMMTDTLLEV